MGRSALVLALVALSAFGCGDDGPPTLTPPPLPDGGGTGGDSGSDGGAGTAGSSGSGGSGGALGGDLCTDHLSGISCQVEEVALQDDILCARFMDGWVKCVNVDDPSLGEGQPFVPLVRPVQQIDALEASEGALPRTEFCAKDADGNAICWFLDGEMRSSARRQGFEPGTVQQIRTRRGGGEACALVEGGTIVCGDGPLNLGTRSIVQFDMASSNFARVGPRVLSRGCAVTDQGEVLCWGEGANADGDLGTNSAMGAVPSPNLPPVEFMDSAKAKFVAKSHGNSCAVFEDGAVRCWGANAWGQLGLGDTRVRGAATGDTLNLGPLPGGAVRELAVSEGHVCALYESGQVKCWGRNTFGQLGLGDVESRGTTPGSFEATPAVDLGSGRTALQVEVSGMASCALLDDHSVKCWGCFKGMCTPDRAVGDAPDELGDNNDRIDFGVSPFVGGPLVSIAIPQGGSDPSVDSVHVGDQLAVTCDIGSNPDSSNALQTESAQAFLFSATDPDTVLASAALQPGASGSYTATLRGLSSLTTGAYVVACVASDDGDPPYPGEASVTILHDGGPLLDILTPVSDGTVGQSTPMHVELSIAPAELGANDAEAGVVSHSLVVAGVEVPLIEDASMPGHFTADVDFFSPEFQPPPSGPISLVLTSTNVRGTTATLQRTVQVDGLGPIIVVQGTNHDDGDIVRGAQVMLLTVTDTPAGVNPAGVYGRISTTTFPFVPTATTNVYRGVFDTLAFDRTVSQLTVEIHAFDGVGNETIEPRTLQLDNQSPVVSLDSAPVREYKQVGASYQCSTPFDPLGDDTVNDQSIVPEGAEFRARVEDRTNGVPGNGIVRIFASVNPTDVDLLVLTDLQRPLLVDTNNDGACDDVNDELASVTGTSQFQTLSLRALPPKGTSLYTTIDMSDVGAEPVWDAFCSAPLAAPPMSPPLVCMPASSSSLLTRIIKAPLAGVLPAIWGLPGGTDTLACAGHYWDWQLSIPRGGPACVAVRATDNVGNIGVSPPIRVCFQRSTGTGNFDCAADLSWLDHDCLAGQYRAATASCTSPPDFGPSYRSAD